MPNNHILTKNIGNLRGFSTDSLYFRPPNVADIAKNLQRSPDATTQIRRGYQCQIGQIGGMGIGTFDNPATGQIQTVCIGTDGYLYNKLTKQIYFYYDGQVTGVITGITNANPGVVHAVNHGLPTGTQVILRQINGMDTLNGRQFTINNVDIDHFSINQDTSNLASYPPYTSGGIWSIAFADQRYLTFSIFTDPLYIYSNSQQSITCNIIANRAAQVNGAQTLTNTIVVDYGHELAATDIVQFTTSVGVLTQRNVLSVTAISITIDGAPVSVNDNIYINQYFNILFGKGFDIISPFTISQFISQITDPITGIYGLQIAINGDSNLPAAFLQIVESTIIDSNSEFTMDYWYWQKVNTTANPPFPGCADTTFQNSPDFENASMCAFDDIIYIANGLDYPQKYDGQTVYRTGMPFGARPTNSDNNAFTSKPFISNDKYQYATTYEQIDAQNHLVEGSISEVNNVTIGGGGPFAENVFLTNLINKPASNVDSQSNWNTNCALAVGGVSASYGPDGNKFYYNKVAVSVGYTLKVGDSAYYADLTAAKFTGGFPNQTGFTLKVTPGHALLPGDTIYFFDTSNVQHQRSVVSIDTSSSPNTITISGDPVTVANSNILLFIVSKVFGNVGITNTSQSNVTQIFIVPGQTLQIADIVNFLDSDGNLQRRKVTNVGFGSVTVDGIPVSVIPGILISSENQRPDFITLQRLNANPSKLSNGTDVTNAISNNLRINIYRTTKNTVYLTDGKLFLVASVPNDSLSGVTQTYVDGLPDTELGRDFETVTNLPDPPPISKYIVGFGNQMFYAGGERGHPENSDRVFFSAGNFPEAVSLATDFFNVPNKDDDITGIGVSGSTLITTKNHSLWAATGNFLSGQIEVIQIAPGTNIGCVAHASIASIGSLMYFLHTNGVYAITENQLFPTDPFGNPVPISLAIDVIFRETNFLPQNKYVLKRAVSVNYSKDKQYLLLLPCEDTQSTIRTANANSVILCYDYEGKNWYEWDNINAAGGFVIINDDLYFQERRYSGVSGNTANLYKQHRFYRLVDHADHAGAQYVEWRSSWEDLGQPEVRKKFSKCVLLMDRFSNLLQYNNPQMTFSSYLNRIPNLQNTIANVTQVDNIRNSAWSISGWGWNYWSGYQDSFININLKQGTVAKSMQVGFTMQGINMDIKLAGFQLEAIPENRKTMIR